MAVRRRRRCSGWCERSSRSTRCPRRTMHPTRSPSRSATLSRRGCSGSPAERGTVIARLRGTPVGRSADGLVLDVGGVGYFVAASAAALRKADGAGEVVVETYLHVREDTLQLYGFADAGERELFVQLLTVNGVGPKVALAILSGSPAAELRRAIAREDAARFQAIPGIGKKTAERIVLELKEKLGGAADAPQAREAGEGHLVA